MNVLLTTNDKIRLDAVALKQLKQLSRSCTGEQLKIIGNDRLVLAKYNNKIIGMCNISMVSPELHFENEIGDPKIPYLYNYMCIAAHKKKRPSVLIMEFIKNLIKDDLSKEINLDVLIDNTHAQNFFQKINLLTRATIFRAPRSTRCTRSMDWNSRALLWKAVILYKRKKSL